jgi:hypothetical protein
VTANHRHVLGARDPQAHIVPAGISAASTTRETFDVLA